MAINIYKLKLLKGEYMKQEELIRKLREFKNGDKINYFTHKNNINDNFFISNYIKYDLEEKNFYDNIKMKFPIDFLELDNDWYNKIFDADYIFSNKNEDFLFLLKIYKVDIFLIKQDVINEINATYNKVVIYDELIELKERKIHLLTFYYDMSVYKLYFIKLEEITLIFNVIYDKYEHKQLKNITNEIAFTIECI